ncbi:hypothetical protein [Pontibacter mangrovi]|nr:hypothetical protein [Pontibacter mangrovi]
MAFLITPKARKQYTWGGGRGGVLAKDGSSRDMNFQAKEYYYL